MIIVLPILIATKTPLTLFITLFVNPMKIRRDTNRLVSSTERTDILGIF